MIAPSRCCSPEEGDSDRREGEAHKTQLDMLWYFSRVTTKNRMNMLIMGAFTYTLCKTIVVTENEVISLAIYPPITENALDYRKNESGIDH